MRMILCSLVFFAGVFIACNPKSEFDYSDDMLKTIPDSVLSADKMIDILVDIQLAEALAIEDKADTIPQEERLKVFYAQIFAIHSIDAKLYQRSYAYYVQEPVIMDHIYQKVTEKLNLLELENLNVSKQNKNE
ncbi:MAG: DUF4296 domain-containing protein [Chitinophagales bacterium]